MENLDRYKRELLTLYTDDTKILQLIVAGYNNMGIGCYNETAGKVAPTLYQLECFVRGILKELDKSYLLVDKSL